MNARLEQPRCHGQSCRVLQDIDTHRAGAVVKQMVHYDKRTLPLELKNEFMHTYRGFLEGYCSCQARCLLGRYPVTEFYSDRRELRDDLLNILVTDLIFDGGWPTTFQCYSRQHAADYPPGETMPCFIRWRGNFLPQRLLSQLPTHYPVLYLHGEELPITLTTMQAAAVLVNSAGQDEWQSAHHTLAQTHAGDHLTGLFLRKMDQILSPLAVDERQVLLRKLCSRIETALSVGTVIVSRSADWRMLAVRMLELAGKLLAEDPSSLPEHAYLHCFICYVGEGDTLKAIAADYGTRESTVFQWVRKAGRLLREQDPYLELLWEQLNDAEAFILDAMRWQQQENLNDS